MKMLGVCSRILKMRLIIPITIILLCCIKFGHCQMLMRTQPEVVTAVKGSTAILKCQVENLGQSKMNWFFVEHNTQISSGTEVLVMVKDKYSFISPIDSTTSIQNLQIKNVQTSDAGFYRCYVNGSNVSVTHKLNVVGAPSVPSINTSPANFTDCCLQQKVSASCMGACVPSTLNMTTFNPLTACMNDLSKLLLCFSDSRNHAGCCRRRSLPEPCIQFCLDKPPQLTLDHLVCLNKSTEIIECFEEGQMILPGPPVEVSVLALPINMIKVNWKFPTDNPKAVTGFRVSHKLTSSSIYMTSSLIEANTLQYNIIGLQGNMNYEVYVTAVGQHGSSLPSEKHIIRTITTAPTSGHNYDIGECCQQRKVSTNCQQTLCTSLSWRYLNPDAITPCFRELDDIFHCLAGGRNHTPCCQRNSVQDPCLPLCSGSPPPLTFELAKCVVYMPTIEGCIQQGMSTLPSSPRFLTLEDVTSSSAELSWSPPSAGTISVKSYLIQIREIREQTDFENLEEVTSPFIKLTDLKPLTEYEVRVVTVGQTASSLPSDSVVFLTYANKTEDTTLPPNQGTAYLHNISACCIEKGVPEICRPVCSYDVNVIKTEISSRVLACEPYIRNILSCAADGRDHTGCCRQRNVLDSCITFCNFTESSPLHITHVVCLQELAAVTECYREGIISLPKHPVKVTVLNTTANVIDLSWEKARTGPSVDYYLLSYSPDLLNWTSVNVTATRYIIQNLKASTMYSIEIQSVNVNGTSPPSNRINVFTETGVTPSPPMINGTVVDGRVIWANREECCKSHNMSKQCFDLCTGQARNVPVTDCVDGIPVMMACTADGVDHRPCCQREGVPAGCLSFCQGHAPENDFVTAACLTYIKLIMDCSQKSLGLVPSEPSKFTVEVFEGIVKVGWKRPIRNCDPKNCTFTILYWRVSEDKKHTPLDGPEASAIERVTSPYDIKSLNVKTYYKITVVAQNDYGGSRQAPSQTVYIKKFGVIDVGIIQSPEGVIDKGNAVKFLCDAVANPTPNITWVKDGKAIASGSRIKIMNVKKENEGLYTCQASTPDDNGNATALLTVRYKPELTVNRDITVWPNKGVTGVIACWFKGVPDASSIKWTKDGKVFRAVMPKVKQYTEFRSHTGIVVSQLRIYNVVLEDYGTYTCRMANKFGSAQGAVRLINPDEPKPTSKPAPKQSNVTECCIQRHVEKSCMVACTYDIDINAIVQNPQLFHCVRHLGAYAACAADGRDHSQCCIRKKVSNYCLPFCAGNIPAGDQASMLNCIVHADNILKCIEENRDYVPNAPVIKAHLSGNSIVVSWQKPSMNGDKVKQYQVFMKAAGIPETKYLVSKSLFTYTFHNIMAHLTYQVWVIASNDYGQSTKSNIKTVNTSGAKPLPPSKFFSESLSSTTVRLRWSPPLSGLPPDGYIIYYKKVTESTYTEIPLGNIFTYRLEQLDVDSSFEAYVVSELFDGGLSVPSNTVLFNTGGTIVKPTGPEKRTGASPTQIGLAVGLTLLVVAIIIVVVLIFFIKFRRNKGNLSTESVSFENPSYGRNQVQISGLSRDVMQPSNQFTYDRLDEEYTINEKRDLKEENQDGHPEMNGNNPATLPVTADEIRMHSSAKNESVS